jgi:hypothetical protein
MFDWPPLSSHAVAMPTDLHPNHARGAELRHAGLGGAPPAFTLLDQHRYVRAQAAQIAAFED